MHSERVALVTGAARGIGAATVAELCATGVRRHRAGRAAAAARATGVGYPMATRIDLDSLVAGRSATRC